MKYFIGVDLGTSSVKAILMSEEGNVINSASMAYSISIPQAGWAEQNPLDWWESAKAVLRKITAENPVESTHIFSMGFSGQMHGLVAVDKSGEPVYPAIIWLDQRSKAEVDKIYSTIGHEKFDQITFNRASTGFALSSLIWLKENKRQIFEKIHKIMLPKDFIRYKLTGVIGTDASDASSTTMFDTLRRNWSEEIINKLHIPMEILPDVSEADEFLGQVTKRASEETGLPFGVPVAIGGGDQPVQNIGNGAIKNGIVCCSIGTSGQIATFYDKPVHDTEYRTHTFCHAVNRGWSVFGAVLCSGLSLRWLKNQVLLSLGYDDMDTLAEQAAPGCEGLIFTPYLTGERTPYFDPDAKGMFFGLQLKHDRSHMIRSVMEGVVFSLRQSLDLFTSMGIVPEKIIASGGGARSPIWLQMQADIFGCPVVVAKISEQACMGAAIIGAVAAGTFKSYDEAIEKIIKYDERIYEPSFQNAQIYKSNYGIYKSLYIANKELYKML